MGIKKANTFERSIRACIGNLSVENCRKLLDHGFEEHGNREAPVFIYICHEKAIWKSTAAKLGIDLEAKWNEEELTDLMETKEQDYRCSGIKESCTANGLKKIIVDGVLEQFALLFVEFGYDIDACDFSGKTALHLAVKHGFMSTAKLLVKSGASLSRTSPIASWIRTQLPALYHSLYTLDVEMTQMVMAQSVVTRSDLEKHSVSVDGMEKFAYLPKKIPERIRQHLQAITKVNPRNFLLITLVIKAYDNPNINSKMLAEMVEVGRCFARLFNRMNLDHVAPRPLVGFQQSSLASMNNLLNESRMDRFFPQLINSLYDVCE